MSIPPIHQAIPQKHNASSSEVRKRGPLPPFQTHKLCGAYAYGTVESKARHLTIQQVTMDTNWLEQAQREWYSVDSHDPHNGRRQTDSSLLTK
jgi:hypothetical protein